MLKKSFVAGSLVVAALIVGAGVADAQTRPYAAGFGGYSRIPTLTIGVSDPTIASDLQVEDRKIGDGGVVGGSAGVWNRTPGKRLVWGVRGEVSFQTFSADTQTVSASGTLFGQPFRGPIPVPAGEGSIAIYTGTALMGWTLGDGRAMPYIGGGAGMDRARISFPTMPNAPAADGTDTALAVHGLAGIELAIGGAVSLYGEYRFSRLQEHDFMLNTQRNVLSAQPSHLVVGVRVGR